MQLKLPITPHAVPFSHCLFPPRERPGTPYRNWKIPTMQHELIDVLIVEDENELAQLHAELIGKHPRLRLVGIAASLADAQVQLESKQPKLMLLDNYLPDGKGITLISNPMLTRANCSVIFITAASDMDTCSGPFVTARLTISLSRFPGSGSASRWSVLCSLPNSSASGRLSTSRTWIHSISYRRKTIAGQRQQRDRGEHAGAGANAV